MSTACAPSGRPVQNNSVILLLFDNKVQDVVYFVIMDRYEFQGEIKS
jgi:hypothetical protein